MRVNQGLTPNTHPSGFVWPAGLFDFGLSRLNISTVLPSFFRNTTVNNLANIENTFASQ
jgi:hypothetical protein